METKRDWVTLLKGYDCARKFNGKGCEVLGETSCNDCIFKDMKYFVEKECAKPLTIEELLSLKEGDWIWIVTQTNTGEYYQKFYESSEDSFAGGSLHYGFNASYEDYGTKWIAYKNKEQADIYLKENNK